MESVPFDPIREFSLEARQAADAAAAAKTDELGREDFLRLLITKMENQDPMSPSQDTEFIAQLATFSSLEQLISVNSNLENIDVGQANLLSSQALNLIGKEVLVASGNEVRVTNGMPDTLVYALPQNTHSANLTVLDETGQPVRTFHLDTTETGRGTIRWDGLDNNGNPVADGTYTLALNAMDAGGETVDAALFRSLAIDGVNFLDGGITLVSGNDEIPFDSVLEIREG